ncbi:MAG TPA: oxidoreductase [Solirubrobacteraceae bacterium]|jgi:NAD(P)-dependent dehydrogenase (short-subunit alcohol dehydrogenase family)|nr:oxidoreductase [Solirubrobacteraceae bacterium]
MGSTWSSEQIPDQSGRTAIVTGANSGLGLSVARELAKRGARVVMACRNLEKGQRALQDVRAAAPNAEVELGELDLASLASIESFAIEFRSAQGEEGLDLLINNAGVMAPPRRETADGFELQFGTNVLGHFALTGRLISLMAGREDARVVTVSSNAHKIGRINFDDLQSERRYRRWGAYGQSKLGDLLFALELDRRLRAAGSTIKSMGAHPGYSATNLQTAAPPLADAMIMRVTNLLVAQSADMGALSLLYAATEPGLPSGSYAGPDGHGEHRGRPKVVRPSRAARDEATASRLWEVCESLTSVHFDLGAPARA